LKILIASDHAGFVLKKELLNINQLNNIPIEWLDLGPTSEQSVDYPDYADLVAQKINSLTVQSHQDSLETHVVGILVCGSGQGMCMRANKYPNVRAALCLTNEMAELSRAHNNANILCLGARTTSFETAHQMLQVFVKTPFEGGRHANRVSKLSSLIKS
jgi:ribose 5-phosphate isomerase B